VGERSLSAWNDCKRCDRHTFRINPFVPEWPATIEVLVLVRATSRAAQAAQAAEPVHLDAAEQIVRQLDLPSDGVVVAHLVACGFAQEVTPDEVAACSGRFLRAPEPKVVVLLGEHVAALAEAAGIAKAGRWELLASAWTVPVLAAKAVDSGLLYDLGQILGRSVKHLQVPVRSGLAAAASQLFELVGEHTGHRRLKPGANNWTTARASKLLARTIERHLNGHFFVSAFHPRGPWAFVVIDIDRHNALQARNFVATVGEALRALPNSIEVQSSASGGRHLYVKLPNDTTYEEAALTLRFYLAQAKLLWLDSGGDKRLRTLRVEVPTDPPRLPFGAGSWFPGDSRPIVDQVAEFAARLAASGTSDFETARDQVRNALHLHGSWRYSHVTRITKALASLEVEHLPEPRMDPANPLASIVNKLPNHLQKVVAHGIPSYGTRTRWTRALGEALVKFMSPDEAADRLAAWLATRIHTSADLENEPQRVVADAIEALRRSTKHTGVPSRIWSVVEEHVRLVHRDMQSPSSLGQIERHLKRKFHNASAVDLDALLATAFHILCLFCERGVRTRTIGHRHFGTFANKNHAHDIEIALTSNHRGTGWITRTMSSVPGVISRRYMLSGLAWPHRPGEPRTYKP
jgi:hypothetical protein